MAKDENPFGVVDEDGETRPVRKPDPEAVVKFGGAANRRDEIEPLQFTIGDEDSYVFTVYEPDGGTVMDIEEARTTRRTLQLFFGDDWGRAEPLLEAEQPDTMVDLATALSRHFKLYQGAPEGNRATRRRQRK